MNNKELQKMYQDIRRTYFPKWDKKCEWKLELVEDLNGSQGFCDTQNKTIYTLYINNLIIIHEICHAVTEQGHNKKWTTRTELAAKDAEKDGDSELATEIRNQLEAYDMSPKITAKMVYNEVQDIAYMSSSDISYEDTIEFVRRNYGMSERDFLKKYKKTRQAYDEGMENKF